MRGTLKKVYRRVLESAVCEPIREIRSFPELRDIQYDRESEEGVDCVVDPDHIVRELLRVGVAVGFREGQSRIIAILA